MWHAPGNEKLVIKGKFKELFLEGVYEALEGWFVDGDATLDHKSDDWALSYIQYSNPYAKLTNREKLWALSEVTRGLTTKCSPPELLQWNESAVHAVFESILSEIIVEIDHDLHDIESDDKFRLRWRKLASEAQREVIRLHPDDYIDPESQNAEEWETVIKVDLAETILWDEDFLDDDYTSDDAPYFAPIPVVTDEMLYNAKAFLRKTFGIKTPKDEALERRLHEAVSNKNWELCVQIADELHRNQLAQRTRPRQVTIKAINPS